MDCSIAIEIMPMDTPDEETLCAVVDECIAYIASCGLNYKVGPFETAIEGSFEDCMACAQGCIKIATSGVSQHCMAFMKVDYQPEGLSLTTEKKLAQYKENN